MISNVKLPEKILSKFPKEIINIIYEYHDGIVHKEYFKYVIENSLLISSVLFRYYYYLHYDTNCEQIQEINRYIDILSYKCEHIYCTMCSNSILSMRFRQASLQNIDNNIDYWVEPWDDEYDEGWENDSIS